MIWSKPRKVSVEVSFFTKLFDIDVPLVQRSTTSSTCPNLCSGTDDAVAKLTNHVAVQLEAG